jgi:hypothetical protein
MVRRPGRGHADPVRRMWGVLLAVALVGAGGAVASAGVTTKVVGGGPAPASYSFVGALIRPGTGTVASRQFCGSALIAPTWVLTAAHCSTVLQGTTGGLVVLGRADLTATGGEEIGIKSVIRNDTWTGQGGSAGDLALLELDRPSTVAPVPLLTAAAEPAFLGTAGQGTIAGWGYTIASGGGQSTKLLSAALPVFPDNQCQQTFGPGYDAAHLLCAGGPSASACNGDSGGPLLVTDATGRLAVAGLSSFGPRVCGRSAYTRVSAYTDWIAERLVTTTPPTSSPPTTAAPRPTTRAPGYSLLAADGTVHSFGSAPARGGAGACKSPKSCADIAGPVGGGYWISRGSCEISAFGPVAAVASPATDERCTLASSGKGLWALTPSGRVFVLAGAKAYGRGASRPKLSWLQIEPRPQGDGYWLLGSDSGVAGFGGAKLLASSGGRLVQPVVGMGANPAGTGYWVVARDGSVAAFGTARFLGAVSVRPKAPIIGIQSTPSGAGYWVFGGDGAVFAFGDARSLGNAVGRPGPIVAALAR